MAVPMILQPAQAVLRALNHLLLAESWAVERLRPFAGQSLRIEGGPLSLDLQVDENGLFRQPEVVAEPAVIITLPADTAWRLLTDRQSIFAAARLAGAADFAETLAFVFRNLRWDAEGDLAGIVGDIAARRLSQAGRQLFAWQATARQNLATNLAEYATEDSDLLAPAREVRAFGQDVAHLQNELTDLERRLRKLAG